MNRWEVETNDGKPLMLYGNSVEEIMSKYGDLVAKVVRICTYPQELFNKLTALPVIHRDNKGREYREVNLGCGYCTYRISKDEADGRYYDLVQYRRNGGRVVEPCLWSTCSASEFAELYLKPVPEKKCGWLFSVKEVKKLCGKSLFKVGAITVWRDADGYYYIGDSREWGKRKKKMNMLLCIRMPKLLCWLASLRGFTEVCGISGLNLRRIGWNTGERLQRSSLLMRLHCIMKY